MPAWLDDDRADTEHGGDREDRERQQRIDERDDERLQPLDEEITPRFEDRRLVVAVGRLPDDAHEVSEYEERGDQERAREQQYSADCHCHDGVVAVAEVVERFRYHG